MFIWRNIHTDIHTLVIKPYTHRIYKDEQTTDKGEVGGSSPPRPTIAFNLSIKYFTSLFKEYILEG